jgi:hypothetical protein
MVFLIIQYNKHKNIARRQKKENLKTILRFNIEEN